MVMVSVLVTALLLPASALAAKATSFEASGDAWIEGLFPTWVTGRVMHAADEPVNGVITSSPDWDALLGAGLETLHDSQIVLNPDGSFHGSLHGRFTLYATGGTLRGNMSGKVSGRAVPGEDYISDSGTWTSTSGTGAFAKVKAGGTWDAYLIWDDSLGTYVGTITIRGTYL
jgi:hypothetical protein